VRSEHGGALVETLLVGLLFFVPLFWLTGVLADVHRGTLAAASAARDAGSELTRASRMEAGVRSADDAIARAARDLGVDANDLEVRIVAPQGLNRGAPVTVEVAAPIRVVQAPFLGDAGGGPRIWVHSTYSAMVERYASRP
jgi:hypothetical protein